MITDRLIEITKFINKNDRILDIGCDHALLDIYLYLHKNVHFITAVDTSFQAIDNAFKNLLKYGLEGKITVKISDGFKSVDVNQFDTVIMSGLGGRTMIQILKKDKLKGIKKVVLQPNNNAYETRKHMMKNGYKIVGESYVEDNKKMYQTICFEKGFKIYSYKELYFGPIMIKNNDKKIEIKLENEINNIKKILKNKDKINVLRKFTLNIKLFIFKNEIKRLRKHHP